MDRGPPFVAPEFIACGPIGQIAYLSSATFGLRTRAGSMREAGEARKIRDGAGERREREAHVVRPRRQHHGAEDDIRAQNVDRLAVDGRTPPWMADVVEQQEDGGGGP